MRDPNKNKPLPPSELVGRGLVGRVATACLVAAFAVGAWRVLGSELAEAPLLDRVTSITQKGVTAPPVAPPTAGIPCGGDGARAEARIAVARLNQTIRGDTLRDLEIVREAVIDTTTSLLRCDPSNAYAWFWLGIAELTAIGLSPERMERFDLSDALAPAERWIVEARVPYYASLAEAGIDGFGARARRDLDAMIQGSRTPYRAEILAQLWPNTLMPTFSAAVAMLPDERRLPYERRLADRARADMAPRGAEVFRDPFTGRVISRPGITAAPAP